MAASIAGRRLLILVDDENTIVDWPTEGAVKDTLQAYSRKTDARSATKVARRPYRQKQRGHDKRQFELELPHQHFRQLCTYVTKAHRGDVKLSKGAVTLLRRASEAWLKCMLMDDAYSMQENGVKANPTQAMIRKHLGDVLYWLPAIRSGISPAQ